MAKPTDDRDGRDENAPATPAADDPTERHLLRARELLREARSRLTTHDDEYPELAIDPQPITDESE